ncbi:MAG: hypothetical protein RLZZ28_1311 [Bacteroidota bacterium]
MTFCFYQNSFKPQEEAAVPVTDLGLQRGYAIFDFLRVTESVPLFIDDHLSRFYQSASLMRLPIKYRPEELKEIIHALLNKNKLPFSGIKILLTGGATTDGYSIGEPVLIITQQPIAPPSEKIFLPGFQLYTYPHQRQMPEVKTTDYLMAISLQPWLTEKGGNDILYYHQDMVSECPRSNFFIVTESNEIITPAKKVLQGITRKQLLQIAQQEGFTITEKDVSLRDIVMAKEAFITSSTKRLIPVTGVDGFQYPAFSEQGITAKLFKAFLNWEKSAIHGYR